MLLFSTQSISVLFGTHAVPFCLLNTRIAKSCVA